MSRYNPRTLVQTPSVSDWGKAGGAATGYGVATGGIGAPVSTGVLGDGFTYNFLTFNALGTLTVTKAGLFDVLVCAGGGGGGYALNHGGGGGGGSPTPITTVHLTTNQSIVIGAGGAGGVTGSLFDAGKIGTASSVGTALALMGGGGGCGSDQPATIGGCGAGGRPSTGSVFNTGSVAGLPAVGFGGGNGAPNLSNTGAGGGGGAGAVGVAAGASNTGGAGGAGVQVNTFIGGATLFKAGGGGGGGGTGGAGGSSVGGAGGSGVAGSAASANTGGGGGGGGASSDNGGNGGSGIVYVRFKV